MSSMFSAGAASIIFSNGRDLLIGDIHGRGFRTLVQSRNRGVAVGVDFHFQLRRIFWTDTVQDKVIWNVQIAFLEAKASKDCMCVDNFSFLWTDAEPFFVFKQKWTFEMVLLIITTFLSYAFTCNISNKACIMLWHRLEQLLILSERESKNLIKRNSTFFQNSVAIAWNLII